MTAKSLREIYDYDSQAEFDAAGGAAKYGGGLVKIGGSLYAVVNGVQTAIGGASANPDAPAVVTSAAGGPNIASGTAATANAIDPAVISATILGGSVSGPVNGGANKIGANIPANVIPVGGASNNNAANTATSGAANYSQVFGYDNTANGLMSCIIGSHSLTYSGVSHGVVIGSQSSIQGASDASVVLGNRNSVNGSSYSAITGGYQNYINSTGNYNAIYSGLSNTISGTAQYCAVLGGLNNSISGAATSSMVFGQGITIASSAQYSFAFGKNLDAKNHRALTIGGSAASSGASQFCIMDEILTTTNATPTFFSGGFDTSANQCVSGEIHIVCRNVTDSRINRWKIPVAVKVNSAGNGLTASTAVGANVVDAAQTLTEDTMTAPVLDLTISQKIFVKVTGIAGKTMNWRCEYKLSSVI